MPSLNEKRETARGTTERNRAIVSARIQGMPYAEITKQFGVSHARIANIMDMYKLRALRYNREKETVHVRNSGTD